MDADRQTFFGHASLTDVWLAFVEPGSCKQGAECRPTSIELVDTAQYLARV